REESEHQIAVLLQQDVLAAIAAVGLGACKVLLAVQLDRYPRIFAKKVYFRVGVVIEPVTLDQAHLARQAYFDFGRGHHAAGLNVGDCFAYALAKATAEPLLFKGSDFSKTDVEAAV